MPGLLCIPLPERLLASTREDHHSSLAQRAASLTCVEGAPEPRGRRMPAAELLVCPGRCDIGSRLDLGWHAEMNRGTMWVLASGCDN